MAQQVIMAVAQTDHEGTLLRPVISVHGSIKEAEEHFLNQTLNPLLVSRDEAKVESLQDDRRIVYQVNLTGTTTIDIDLDNRQVCATIKVVS